MRSRAALAVLALAGASALPAEGPAFDVLIRGGTVYDGTGGAPREADVGIVGDRIAAVGELSPGGGRAPSSTRAAWPWPPASSTCCPGPRSR